MFMPNVVPNRQNAILYTDIDFMSESFNAINWFVKKKLIQSGPKS